jgi:hypothetical protein
VLTPLLGCFAIAALGCGGATVGDAGNSAVHARVVHLSYRSLSQRRRSDIGALLGLERGCRHWLVLPLYYCDPTQPVGSGQRLVSMHGANVHGDGPGGVVQGFGGLLRPGDRVSVTGALGERAELVVGSLAADCRSGSIALFSGITAGRSRRALVSVAVGAAGQPTPRVVRSDGSVARYSVLIMTRYPRAIARNWCSGGR